MEKQQLVEELCSREWQMFVRVNNRGGQASCQKDEDFFKKMRACQFEMWSEDMLRCYRTDLILAEGKGRNLPMEKYAWMMESTHPSEFIELRDSLPVLAPESTSIIEELVQIHLRWEAEVDAAYPATRANGRPLRKEQDTPWSTSFETYLAGELKTYSLETLRAFIAHVRNLEKEGMNMALMAAENTARAYGFASLDEAEAHARKKAGLR